MPTCSVTMLVLWKELRFVVAVDETSGSGHVTIQIYREDNSLALASLDELLLSSQSFVHCTQGHQQYTQCLSWFFILERYESCGQRNTNIPGTRSQETRLRRKQMKQSEVWGEADDTRARTCWRGTKISWSQLLRIIYVKRLNLHSREISSSSVVAQLRHRYTYRVIQ